MTRKLLQIKVFGDPDKQDGSINQIMNRLEYGNHSAEELFEDYIVFITTENYDIAEYDERHIGEFLIKLYKNNPKWFKWFYENKLRCLDDH